MNTQDAAHHTVHDYPGGSVSLAPRIGMSAAVLRNKVNPHCQTHHLTLDEADRIMSMTGDCRMLHALAANHGHVCVAMPGDAPASDLAVLEMVTSVWRSNGDVGRAIDDVLSDGRVDAHELPTVEAAIYQHIQTLQALLQRLQGMSK